MIRLVQERYSSDAVDHEMCRWDRGIMGDHDIPEMGRDKPYSVPTDLD